MMWYRLIRFFFIQMKFYLICVCVCVAYSVKILGISLECASLGTELRKSKCVFETGPKCSPCIPANKNLFGLFGIFDRNSTYHKLHFFSFNDDFTIIFKCIVCAIRPNIRHYGTQRCTFHFCLIWTPFARVNW